MKKALIVDDTKNIRMLLTKCLEIEGYQVDIASDGLEALQSIGRESFDFIFLDIKMPHLSGTEVLKRIRDMGIKTPVAIITAYPTIKNTFECTQLGAVAYIQKPFTAEKIRSVLAELSKQEPQTSIVGDEELIIRAENMIENQQFNDAIVALRKALFINSLNKKIYYLLSKTHESLGNLAEANKYMSLFHALHNQNPDAL